jgi:hypothetical protein
MFSAAKTAAPSGTYTISRSVRFRSSASAYLNRTPASATNQQKWTWSAWVKIGDISNGSTLVLFSSGDGTTNNYCRIEIVTNQIQFINVIGGSSAGSVQTTSVYRDPSAWYHIVVAVDTTQATAANRAILYVNGVSVAWTFSTNVTQNSNTWINSANAHYLTGRQSYAASGYFDGYLTEVNFIDGQALTPSSFGSNNAVTGVWQPIKYTGTYGTNGFYLNFSDNSAATAAAIGKDYSGNGNNWTPNNISVTAGATYDSMIDVPTPYTDSTITYNRGNYCVLNPLDVYGITPPTFQAANLEGVFPNAGRGMRGSTGMSSGKWYYEFNCTNVGSIYNTIMAVGVAAAGQTQSSSTAWMFSIWDGVKTNGGSSTAYGTGTGSGTVGIVGVAIDMNSGKIWWSRNGTWQASGDPAAGTNPAFTGLTGPLFPYIEGGGGGYSGTSYLNFGQRPFSYTPPTGFVALNTYNLPDSTITNGAKYMAATTYTGTGATASISNAVNSVSMQPDFVWIKSRSQARSHRLQDSVRGVGLRLASDLTDAETTDASSLTAFNSNGFSLGTNINYNNSAETYVAWQWKASGTTVSNTNGSITSTVSVGATQGFSVVTYTGTGANATVGHGLGVAPKMIIVKARNSAQDWPVYHASIGNDKALYLDLTNAQSGSSSTIWNNTSPTSSVFSLGTIGALNGSTTTYVAYCFAEVAGYSKFGSYTGNGSADGAFVYTGFRPRFLLIKVSSTTGSWTIVDTSRDTFNLAVDGLYPDLAQAEDTSRTIDILSNGFKFRSAANNINAATFIYAAFAENPFKNALAR